MKCLNQRKIHLKIKIKTLVEESKIIKHEENKFKWKDESKNFFPRTGLREHRTTIVRDHTRHNLLAYGLLNNVPYEKIESKCKFNPNFERIRKTAKNFGAKDIDIDLWIIAAKNYINNI